MDQLAKIKNEQNNKRKGRPAVVTRISEYRKLINLRNILIHGYAEVDDHLVWDLLQSKLPGLIREIEAIHDQE